MFSFDMLKPKDDVGNTCSYICFSCSKQNTANIQTYGGFFEKTAYSETLTLARLRRQTRPTSGRGPW